MAASCSLPNAVTLYTLFQNILTSIRRLKDIALHVISSCFEVYFYTVSFGINVDISTC